MINFTFTNEDVELVEKFIDIKNKGFYCDGVQLTEVYNRVLGKHVTPTNCGSCIRQRVNELEGALNHFKRTIELNSKPVEEPKQEEPTVTKVEEKKPVREAKNKRVIK